MAHKLLIKEHKDTGLKYLCYTQKDNHSKYTGSGVYWLKHIKEHGYNVSTKLIFKSESYDEFKKVAIETSNKFNIVESDEWANLRIEEGDGGDTVSQKRWITDGKIDIYINKNEELPKGWRLGRSNCVFNDSNKQREFGMKADIKKRGKSIKQAWKAGKFDARVLPDISGDNNPLYDPKVREKHKQSQNTPEIKKLRSEQMKRLWNDRKNIN